MELALYTAALVILTVFPVMLAGKLLRAGKTGVFACVGAALVSALAGNMASNLIGSPLLAALVALVFTAIGFVYLLEAKWLQSILIALLAMALQWLTAVLLAAFGVAVSHFSVQF